MAPLITINKSFKPLGSASLLLFPEPKLNSIDISLPRAGSIAFLNSIIIILCFAYTYIEIEQSLQQHQPQIQKHAINQMLWTVSDVRVLVSMFRSCLLLIRFIVSAINSNIVSLTRYRNRNYVVKQTITYTCIHSKFDIFHFQRLEKYLKLWEKSYNILKA